MSNTNVILKKQKIFNFFKEAEALEEALKIQIEANRAQFETVEEGQEDLREWLFSEDRRLTAEYNRVYTQRVYWQEYYNTLCQQS